MLLTEFAAQNTIRYVSHPGDRPGGLGVQVARHDERTTTGGVAHSRGGGVIAVPLDDVLPTSNSSQVAKARPEFFPTAHLLATDEPGAGRVPARQTANRRARCM